LKFKYLKKFVPPKGAPWTGVPHAMALLAH